MLFSSFSFLIFFLPAILLGYFFLPVKLRNSFLLVGSIFFYAWGELQHLYIIAIVIVVSYMVGLNIEKAQNRKKLILGAGIAILLGLLCIFKYADFFLQSYGYFVAQKPELLKIALPIGISFYVFQAISYMVDVYKKIVPVQHNLFSLAMYISFFPQLVAGPIVKYRDFLACLSSEKRYICWDDVLTGIRRFTVGLGKKVVIADSMAQIADAVFAVGPAEISPTIAWLGAVAYSLQIYFDFSGYSDMAIGLGRIFGFRFLENFNYPYIAMSLTDFWRRWHISLSTWFKDYVYIPLGGNKCSTLRHNLNLLMVFSLTGLWHGANYTFVIWGLWHGFFLLLEKQLLRKGLRLKRVIDGANKDLLYGSFGHIYTILVFVLGWVIFRAASLTEAMNYIGVMFGIGAPLHALGWQHYLHNKLIIVGVFAILLCIPWRFSLIARSEEAMITIVSKDILILIIFLLSFMFMAAGTFTPFIYFKF